MNGFAGFWMRRKMKQEIAVSPLVLIKCAKACAGRAVGLVAGIGEINGEITFEPDQNAPFRSGFAFRAKTWENGRMSESDLTDSKKS